MRSSLISAAVLALVSSVLAQTAGFDPITSPTQDQNIPAGSSFDLIWEPGTVTGTITITLLQGATPSTLQAGPVIAKSVDNTLGKYTWSVPSTSSYATYGFEIVLDSTASSSSPTLQYSFPFHITGGTSGSASATGTPSTTTMHLSTGPNYSSSSAVVTSTSTSLIPSSTLTVVSTSVNGTSPSATLSSSPSSNITLSTLKTTSTKTAATTGSSSTSTSSSAPATSTNAAVSNIATGGLAMIGGIVLAFAL